MRLIMKSRTDDCGTLRIKRLPCATCRRRYPYTKQIGKPTNFDFGINEPPTSSCRAHKNDSLCRYYVAARRTASAADLASLWSAEREIAWVTILLPHRELGLPSAAKIRPESEVGRFKRLFKKAVQDLPLSETRKIKAIGAVELGLVEVRSVGGEVQKFVVVHVHVLVWGIQVDRIRNLLRPATVKTEIERVPLQVQTATDPEGALGYSFAHVNDHLTSVRCSGRKSFDRQPEGEELQVQQGWCSFPAAEAEVLIGLRRHPDGRITSYSRMKND